MKLRRIGALLLWNFLFACACQAAFATAEGDFQRTLNVSGAVNLEVSTGSGSVRVRSGSAGRVEVHGHVKAGDWFGGTSAEERVKRIVANPPIQQDGDVIRVGHIEDSDLRQKISISYDIVVPAETQLHSSSGSGSQTVEGIKGPAEIMTGSGSEKISDLGDRLRAETGSGGIEIDHVKGDVWARAGSGSIRATDVAGAFEGNTGSGHISLEQTAPGAVRADTGSGGVELRGVHGSLDARAGSGTIQAEGDPSGPWSLRTGSGGVRLHLPSDAAFDLDAHTSSGSISVDHPVTVQGTVGRRELRGKVRGGGTPVIVETGSGDIQIQ
jgi:DUF4097 and DUF4098 domain-containing protein YvlB